MAEKKEMKIAEVKGRPMLHWIGKQPLETVKSFPSQLVEKFNLEEAPQVPTFESLKKNWTNLLFHGDNKEVLSTLLVNGFRGKIDLIYIDPPFDSGADYVRKVELRGVKKKVTGEEQSLVEQIQYTDIWANDNYLQFMYERLILLRELLSEKGSIYLHCDWHKSHFLRLLLDEVFGDENFFNEIIWENQGSWIEPDNKFPNRHNNIYAYSKTKDRIFNRLFEANFSNSVNYKRWSDYIVDDKIYGNNYPSQDSRFNTYLQKFIDENEREPEMDDVIVDFKGEVLGSLWYIKTVDPKSSENKYYPTQKPESLIERIVKSSSDENSIILDCFLGSGTISTVAQKLGKKWIGCDINKGAIQTTSKRLQNVIKEQIKEIEKEKSKLDLEEKKTIFTSFAHYKINDYDLQIQHNELKLLVYEHIGVKKLATDSFFDGTLGTELVKIIPFNHPLSLLDLQLVKTELEKRKDETRNIVLVSLGMEVKVKTAIDDYNKLRPVNKIRTIELRTDKKYGSFFVHKPAQAEVEITKTKDKGKVILKDFISPTIIQRLNIDSKLFQAQIKDFRSQIDVVLIDTDYNGEVFNICISDVPEKKKDFVKGEYEFAIKNKDSKIAVKIIDMLGEEVLIIE
jgi:adenine-specific DNA-methyltransferase